MVVSNDDDPPPNPFGVKLKKRGIPFVFHSGHCTADTLPPEMAAVITPIQQLLQQVCLKSVVSIKQA